MSRSTVSIFRSSSLTTDIVLKGGAAAVTEIWRRLKNGIFDPYRPELHYMRGPGPKSASSRREGDVLHSAFRQCADAVKRRTI
jgi:hypothetical protein